MPIPIRWDRSTTLVDADTALDEALDSRRAATNLRKRNVELRETGTTAAAAKVSAARDFIATRRGASADRGADSAGGGNDSSPRAQKRPAGEAVEAVDEARRAGALADQALMSAQADVVSWQRTEQPRHRGGDPSAIGAVRRHPLVDSFLRGGGGGLGGGRIDTGGFPSRRGDGYSYDGRSPGSFGGSGAPAGSVSAGGSSPHRAVMSSHLSDAELAVARDGRKVLVRVEHGDVFPDGMRRDQTVEQLADSLAASPASAVQRRGVVVVGRGSQEYDRTGDEATEVV